MGAKGVDCKKCGEKASAPSAVCELAPMDNSRTGGTRYGAFCVFGIESPTEAAPKKKAWKKK